MSAVNTIFSVSSFLDRKESRQDALLALVRAPRVDLERAVQTALAQRRISLRDLWRGLEFDGYLIPFPEEKVDGPAPRAYQALFRCPDREEPPQCGGWLLRYRQVRWTYHLRRAQSRLLAACGALYDTDFPLVSRELGQELHSGAFWAYVLLYNARRWQSGVVPGEPVAALGERRVVSVPTDTAMWQRAWEQALLLDRATVLPFLADQGEADADALPTLVCPTLWDKSY